MLRLKQTIADHIDPEIKLVAQVEVSSYGISVTVGGHDFNVELAGGVLTMYYVDMAVDNEPRKIAVCMPQEVE